MSENALLTVLVLSCKRVGLLRRTLPPMRQHFESIEPDLGVRWTCFDNGTTVGRNDLLDFDFDLLQLSKSNLGQGPAINQMISSVRTPYFVLLEDDWELVNPNKLAFFKESVEFMSDHPKVATVKLDTCHFLEFQDRRTYSGPHFSAHARVPFYVQNPNELWGGFCFPPAVTRTEAMQSIGPCIEDQPFRRGWAESYCSSQFARKYCAAKSPEMLLFKHIGEVPSSGWDGT